MYSGSDSLGAGAGIGVLGLAATGAEVLWYVIAGVALIGVGAALMRFIPRKEK